jgi:hypothetical protein
MILDSHVMSSACHFSLFVYYAFHPLIGTRSGYLIHMEIVLLLRPQVLCIHRDIGFSEAVKIVKIPLPCERFTRIHEDGVGSFSGSCPFRRRRVSMSFSHRLLALIHQVFDELLQGTGWVRLEPSL